MSIHTTILKIRHHKYLKKLNFLWDLLRKPYGFFIDPLNKGIPLTINDDTIVRLPLKFYSKDIVNYEQKPTKYLTSWIKNNPDSLVIDLGVATGYLSSIALHSSKSVKVIGIDSDIMSLKISDWLCSYAKGNRFQKVHCFISNRSSDFKTLQEAIDLTSIKLNDIKLKHAIVSNKYSILDTSVQTQIPIYTIDELFENSSINTPILIKCDIEGAEALAIQGAVKFISKYKPLLAISVHPGLLGNYQSNTNEFHELILSFGYNVELISIDHEEHWWCTYIK